MITWIRELRERIDRPPPGSHRLIDRDNGVEYRWFDDSSRVEYRVLEQVGDGWLPLTGWEIAAGLEADSMEFWDVRAKWEGQQTNAGGSE